MFSTRNKKNIDTFWLKKLIKSYTLPYLFKYLNISFLPVDVSKNTWMSGSVDPDKLPHSVASDLGLCCLLNPVCPNT